MVISYPFILSRTVRNVVQQVFGSIITSWTNKKETQALQIPIIPGGNINLLLSMCV